jgi:hypothetical protein
MDRNCSRIPSAMAPVLVILLGLNWTACTTVKERHPYASTVKDIGIGKYYFFDDVLIPKELNYDGDKSFVYETPELRTGLLVFSGCWVDVEPLITFFTTNMAKDNWTLVNSFQGKESILNFSKPEKTCAIRILNEWYGTVEVQVRIGPLK